MKIFNHEGEDLIEVPSENCTISGVKCRFDPPEAKCPKTRLAPSMNYCIDGREIMFMNKQQFLDLRLKGEL